MTTDVSIDQGGSRRPWRGLTVYLSGDGAHVYATTHDLVPGPRGEVEFGPAEPVTDSFLRTLAGGLGTEIPVEFLPDTILYRTNELLAWWVPAQRRSMFFAEHLTGFQPASGRPAPHPPLVFVASRTHLWVRALKRNQRPTRDTPLCVAPYLNTFAGGGVCLGTTPTPGSVGVAATGRWVDGFFNSAFTHLVGTSRLTRHPGGVEGLWVELAGSRRQFPVKHLTEAHQTLHTFVRSCLRTN